MLIFHQQRTDFHCIFYPHILFSMITLVFLFTIFVFPLSFYITLILTSVFFLLILFPEYALLPCLQFLSHILLESVFFIFWVWLILVQASFYVVKFYCLTLSSDLLIEVRFMSYLILYCLQQVQYILTH